VPLTQVVRCRWCWLAPEISFCDEIKQLQRILDQSNSFTSTDVQADRGDDRGGRSFEEGLRVTVRNSGARKPRAVPGRVLEVSKGSLDRLNVALQHQPLPESAASAALFTNLARSLLSALPLPH